MATDAPVASDGRGGRAAKPGPRRLYLGAAFTAIALAVILVLALKPAGPGPVATPGHPVANSGQRVGARIDPARVVPGIGTIPSWLPVPAGGGAGHRIVTATLRRPVTSASQGDTVRAVYGGAAAEITAVGPYVPRTVVSAASAANPAPGSVFPVSFHVTLVGGRGDLPLSRQIFEVVLPTGQAVVPAIAAPGGRPLPAALRPGQHLTVKLAARLPAGNGIIRWAPDGRRALVTWTYQFEVN